MAVMTSASGLLAMLGEDADVLKIHALKGLDYLVDQFWAEISAHISDIETLHEDDSFSHRKLAGLVASKVFYHMGELSDALTYALGAEELFNIHEESEYVETLIAKCIDQYVEISTKLSQEGDVDPRLIAVVEKMLDKCIESGQFQQAIGISLECHRLDKLEESIVKSNRVPEMLKYTLKVSQAVINVRQFRHKVYELLVTLHQKLESPDYFTVCQCLMFLNHPDRVAVILESLVRKGGDSALLAYQVAFDLFQNEFQQFMSLVRFHLSSDPVPHIQERQQEVVTEENAPVAMDTGEENPETVRLLAEEERAAPSLPEVSPEEVEFYERLAKLKSILSGEVPIALTLQFLHSHNKADLLILRNLKQSVEPRNSVCHSAAISANAFMHAGTTVDVFLRENMDWLRRATNWAKFSATAGLGVIHRGHHQQGRSLMAPYLPQAGVSGSPYTEGGALYALGLIHADHGESIQQFLLESLRNAGNEVIQHGACLGLGLASFGTGNEEVYEDLKSILYNDHATASEAAGLAMGLLLAGTGSEKSAEMFTYAHDTQHEKIIRGLALGMALVVYGNEEGADGLILQMTSDQDPILRYGGMYAIGMAYRATSNNKAIRQLLHFAVSDVSNDVRRAAVLCLGFVLCNEPEQTPRIVSLLSESYNPHVRYGAAMAVGIACAGSESKDAVNLLEPLMTDTVDFVRQGALLSMAMVLMQTTEEREPKVATFRRKLEKMVGDKHEETMSKMGAIWATGLLDAGGRNVTVGLLSKSGYDRIAAVIGMAVFTQYWYWYPLVHFISLSFTPTAIIALNKDLRLPKFKFLSGARPSLFGYPAPLSTQSAQPNFKAPSVALSASRSRGSKTKKESEKEMSKLHRLAAVAEVQSRNIEIQKAAESKENEPTNQLLSNPARVLPAQEKFIKYVSDSRYVPIAPATRGFVLLKDLQPELPEELVSTDAAGETTSAPAPPATAPAPAAAAQPGPAAAQPPENVDDDLIPDEFEFKP